MVLQTTAVKGGAWVVSLVKYVIQLDTQPLSFPRFPQHFFLNVVAA